MSVVLKKDDIRENDPYLCDFETAEDAQDYDRFFRAKVAQSLADKNPNMPHDEAMAFVKHELEKRKANRANH